jgi:hypothetical protein
MIVSEFVGLLGKRQQIQHVKALGMASAGVRGLFLSSPCAGQVFDDPQALNIE